MTSEKAPLAEMGQSVQMLVEEDPDSSTTQLIQDKYGKATTLLGEVEELYAARISLLEEATASSETLWSNLETLKVTLKQVQEALEGLEPHGADLEAIEQQQGELKVRFVDHFPLVFKTFGTKSAIKVTSMRPSSSRP